MPYNPAIHHRHSIRLPGYDYSQPGAYYLTILTHKREPLFGEVVGGVVKLSPVGEIVHEEWLKIPGHLSNVVLDVYVIMPDHVHGIVVIVEGKVGKGKGKAFEKRGTQKLHATSSYSIHNNKSTNLGSNALPIQRGSEELSKPGSESGSNALPIRLGSEPSSLPAIVQNFKSITSRKINKLLKTPESTIWHRNYYEHVIRDEEDYARIITYIQQNPQKWEDSHG